MKNFSIEHFVDEVLPQSIGKFVAAVMIAFCAYILSRIAFRLVMRVLGHTRTATLAPVIAGLARVLTLSVGFVTALSHIGIDVSTIIASAGVVGLAVGFGAQTLVKDLISGFFLIFDGVIAVGDTVRIPPDVEGVIESIGLRMTQVRNYSGRLWYVPNGVISTVGNTSREWARAIVEVQVSNDAKLGAVLELLKQAGDGIKERFPQKVFGDPEVQGALNYTESATQCRVALKVRHQDQGDLERELRIAVRQMVIERSVFNAQQ